MGRRPPESAALSIAMVGTRGVPAHYGGFETAIEEVGSRLVERGHTVRVYCRRGNSESRARNHRGMELVTLPALRRRSLETISHTALSATHLVARRTDVAFVFNAANAPFLPLLRIAGIPVATHVDGLEWKRAKWGPTGQRYYRFAEEMAVRWSDALIADAHGISDYYLDEFRAATRLISYGAPILTDLGSGLLSRHGLNPGDFHLVVARFEPENHVHLIVDGYVRSGAQRPLVVVGAAPYADEYTKRIRELARGDDRVRLVGGVWDQDELDQLYGHAATYIHGHSVGGTNPSLLRAMGAGTATIAFDVNFNREVLGPDGRFFASAEDLPDLLRHAETDPEAARTRGSRLQERARGYSWDDVASRYEALAQDLRMGNVPGPHKVRRQSRTASSIDQPAEQRESV